MLACDAMPKRGLVSPNGRAVSLKAVRPNAGVQAQYHKRLDALVLAMHKSLMKWVLAAYRRETPEMAQDASPAREMLSTMRKLGRKWQKRFDEAAPELADYFAQSIQDRADGALGAILKKAGFTVQFKMTAAMNDVFQATVGEQVGLIKSIASQHLSEVEGLVMRSVQSGRDLGYLSKELEARYGVTKRRAALIARSQNNMATANITRARQLEIGITKAIWMHSDAGKHPRPSHVKANGEEYDIAKGMYLDGAWLLPGQALNCRCVAKPIIEGFS